MFSITKNDFINNRKVWYTDEVGNKLLVFQKESGIVFKLRPVIEEVKCKPFVVPWPLVDGSNGSNLEFETHDQMLLDKDEVKIGIQGFAKMVPRWINMINDISQFGLSNLWIQNGNPNLTDEEINKMKVFRLSQYDELRDALKIFTDDEIEFAKRISD